MSSNGMLATSVRPVIQQCRQAWAGARPRGTREALTAYSHRVLGRVARADEAGGMQDAQLILTDLRDLPNAMRAGFAQWATWANANDFDAKDRDEMLYVLSKFALAPFQSRNELTAREWRRFAFWLETQACARHARAEAEGPALVFELSECGAFWHCWSVSDETYEVTACSCTCADGHYRRTAGDGTQYVPVCWHQRALRAGLGEYRNAPPSYGANRVDAGNVAIP